MERTKRILAAGSLTAIVLIAILVFSLGGRADANAGSLSEAVSPAQIQTTGVDQATGAISETDAMLAWQDYSQQLEAELQIMQQRELNYRTELDAANQSIMQLQAQSVAQGQPQSVAARGEHNEGGEDHEFDND